MIYFSIAVKGFGGWIHELFCAPFGSNIFVWPANFLFNLIEYLIKDKKLNVKALTVTGKTMEENLNIKTTDMKKANYYLLSFMIIAMSMISCKPKEKKEDSKTVESEVWEVDFLDDFDTFNPDNWQDQRIWVNNEKQSYVPDGEYGTREVSNGSLKIKVVKIDEKRSSDNLDKFGKQLL